MDNNKHRSALRLALMGALTGGAFGAGAKFYSGAKDLGSILRAAGIGAGVAGGVAGGSHLVGNAVMGEPQEGETNPNAKRGVLGGVLLGALAGGGLGAAGAAGKIPFALKKLAAKFADEIPVENMITRKIGQYAEKPTTVGMKKGALMGAAALGIPMAYEGGDEGMYYDQMQEEIAKEQRRKQIEQIMREQYGV